MATRVFKLPDLGEGLEGAEISRWLVAEGDEVTLNQPLVEVNTEKALVEIPSPFAGKVAELHAGEGDEVAVGAPLVTFEVASDEEPAEAGKRKAVLVGYGVAAEDAPKPKGRLGLRLPGSRKAPTRPGKPLATPAVRKLAKDMGVDLATVTGTGPGGRITREDVEGSETDMPSTTVPDFPGDERVPVKGTRRIIAERMHTSWTQVPHVTTYLTVDCTELEAFRAELASKSDAKVTVMPIVAKALAEVCRDHRELNAAWDAARGEIVLRGAVHVGMATDTEQGLVVPVVRDVQDKGVLEIAAEMSELAEAVRSGRAKREQLSGSTITISNVGWFGAEYGTPIVNVPEVAILAVGVVEPRPRVVGGRVEPRLCCTMSLSFDHRAIDGAQAGWALVDLREHLEDANLLRALGA